MSLDLVSGSGLLPACLAVCVRAVMCSFCSSLSSFTGYSDIKHFQTEKHCIWTKCNCQLFHFTLKTSTENKTALCSVTPATSQCLLLLCSTLSLGNNEHEEIRQQSWFRPLKFVPETHIVVRPVDSYWNRKFPTLAFVSHCVCITL